MFLVRFLIIFSINLIILLTKYLKSKTFVRIIKIYFGTGTNFWYPRTKIKSCPRAMVKVIFEEKNFEKFKGGMKLCVF
jgi:hypothetical protein